MSSRKSLPGALGGLMALVVLLLISAGCTKETFSNQSMELLVQSGGFGPAYFDGVIASFEKDHPGVKINKTDGGADPAPILRTRFASGDVPDLFNWWTLNPTCLSLIQEKNQFTEITDVINGTAPGEKTAIKDKILPGFLDLCKTEGGDRIFFAPSDLQIAGMIYNKAYFDRKSLKVPETWDEFFALGEVAKQDGRALFTYQGIYPGYNDEVIFPAIASAGGMETMNKILGYEEGIWRSEPVRKVLEVYQKLSEDDYLMKGTLGMNHTQSQAEFLKGKALFVPCGNWMEAEMKDAEPEEGFEYGFMPPPGFAAGDKRYVIVYFDSYAIPAKAKNVKLAKEFMRYLYKDQSIKQITKDCLAVPAVVGGADMVKEFISPATYNMFKIFDAGVLPLQEDWKPTPKTDIIIMDEIFNPISSLMNRKLTVDEWIDRIETADTKLRQAIAEQSTGTP